MKNKQRIWFSLGVLGIFLMSSFTIKHNHFVSGIGGVMGCFCLIITFIGYQWPQLKAGDPKAKQVTLLLSGLVSLLIILEIVQFVLN